MKQTLCGFVVLSALLWTPVGYGQAALPKGGCPANENCVQISLRKALALPWEAGVRELVATSRHEISFEGTHQCDKCSVWVSGFLGLGQRCWSLNDLAAHNTSWHRSPLKVVNRGRALAEMQVKLRERYHFEEDPATGVVRLKLVKEIVNSQLPDGMEYQFTVKPFGDKEGRQCFSDEDATFEPLKVSYNRNESVLNGAFGKYQQTYDLGDSGDGKDGRFLMPVNTIVNPEPKSGDSFGYEMRGTVPHRTGHIRLESTRFEKANKGKVFDPVYAASRFGAEQRDFLKVNTTPSRPEFWLSPSTGKLYMTFPNDPMSKPVVFTLSAQTMQLVTMDREKMSGNPIVQLYLTLGTLSELKGRMREEDFESYSEALRVVQETLDLMSGENGPRRGEADIKVRNRMNMLAILLNQNMENILKLDGGAPALKPYVDSLRGKIDFLTRKYGEPSGTHHFAYYADQIKNVINKMRIPDMIKSSTVPPILVPVAEKMQEIYSVISEIPSNKSNSDADVSNGQVVDRILKIFDEVVDPELRRIGKGYEWRGMDDELRDWVNSMREQRGVKTNLPVRNKKP